MASPNTTFTAGQILTAQQVNDLPFGHIGQASSTSLSQTVTTLTDITGMSVTFTAVANRLYRIEGVVRLRTTEGTNVAALFIRTGSTSLQSNLINLQISNQLYTANIFYVSTFTAGSVTVKLSAQRATGSGTLTASSASDGPATIVVTDIGLA
jgi:hypothetical protein